ncbi:MAG: transposase [Terriglobales bacterium]
MTLYRGEFRFESARFKGWDYRSPGWYFVTVCTAGMRPVFGQITSGKMVHSSKAGSLSAIVRSYKAGVTRWAGANGFPDFRWQSRFYDHLLRSNKTVNAVRDYIQNNPMNWLEDELCTKP